MSILVLIVAIIISAVAGFYSVTGLTTIFGGAFWSIVVMGTALELGKVSVTLWLHQHWDSTKIALKIYLTSAIVVLMMITSLGTFGYLSKAHISQSLNGASAQSQLDDFEAQVLVIQQDLADNQNTLKQLDSAIDQVVSHGTSEGGTVRALQLRNNQQKERKQIADNMQKDRTEITALREKEAPAKLQLEKNQVEVGPIKYIAALIYGDNPSQELLERAVRLVIILLVSVFDPLAIAMLLAADQQLLENRRRKPVEPSTVSEPVTAASPATNSLQADYAAAEPAITTNPRKIGKLILPKSAPEGTLFITTDRIPSVLYKFAEGQWIEADKNLNPEYINDDYIEFIIKHLSAGTIKPSLLTAAETEAVEHYLANQLSK